MDYVKIKYHARKIGFKDEQIVRTMCVRIADIKTIFEDYNNDTHIQVDGEPCMPIAETAEDVYCKILEAQRD